MPSTLSDSQLLLINNLLYLENNPPLHELQSGCTVGEFLNDIEISKLNSSKEYSMFTTGEEWRNIINAAKSDPQIANLTISQSHIDAKYGGTSYLLTSSGDCEAIVAFRGTATAEWKDNFSGGGSTNLPDGVSTECQKRSLEWYQSLNLDSYQNVTVTGHSKGGNKAQYIAILDNSVDRCVSFDGQGFSDEFYEKYNSQIIQNQHKIVNNSAESDYVNFLLNSIGEQKYYKGYNYGSDASFAENHCPNTMMTFDKNGNPVMIETKQNKDIKNLDEFLNSYLRAANDKTGSLSLVGDLVQNLQNGEDAQELVNILTDGTHQEQTAFLIAYIFAYREAYPEIVDSIKRILNGLGASDAGSVIDVLISLQDNGLLAGGAQVLGSVLQESHLQNWAISEIEKQTGLNLTSTQYQNLCDILKKAGEKLDTITINTNSGKDMSIVDSYFYLNTEAIKNATSELDAISDSIIILTEEISNITDNLTGFLLILKIILKSRVNSLNKSADCMKNYSNNLSSICNKYITTEKNNCMIFPSKTSIIQKEG